MSKCEKCGDSIEAEETYEFASISFCEDCYLEVRVRPTTRDPWAVYSARRTMQKAPQLTDIQSRLLTLIETEGPLEVPEICRQLGISEAELQNNFATLRHMELARGFKDGDKVEFT